MNNGTRKNKKIRMVNLQIMEASDCAEYKLIGGTSMCLGSYEIQALKGTILNECCQLLGYSVA
jgi:hypothetical protein